MQRHALLLGAVAAAAPRGLAEAQPSARTGRAAIDGGELYYELAGSGPAIVLVPAYGCDTRCWDGQVSALSQVGTVIRYDPRGFGQSTVPAAGQTYSHQRDLGILLDHLGIEHAHVIGISNGGRIAIGFALAYPQRTLSLVAADAAIDGSWPSPDVAAELAYAKKTAAQRGIDAGKRVLVTIMPAFWPARANQTVDAKLLAMTDTWSGWQLLRDDPEHPSVPDATQRLRELHMPVLSVIGEYDPPYIHDVADQILATAPHASRFDMTGVGHFTALEAPAEFNRAVLAFLRQNSVGVAVPGPTPSATTTK